MLHTVRDCMTVPVVSVKPDTTVAAALTLMRRKGIHSVVVEPDNPSDGYGIMTMTDVVKKVAAHDRDPRQVRVREVMTQPIVTASPDWSLKECATRMTALNVRHLPVTDDDGRLVGMISNTDIFMAVEERGWGESA